MRRPLILGVIAGCVLLFTAIIVVAVAITSSLDRQSALDAHTEAADALRTGVARTETDIARAQAVLVHADDPLMPAEPIGLLDGARQDAAAGLQTATGLLQIDAAELDTDEVRETTLALQTASRRLSEGGIPSALGTLRDAVTASADAVDDANLDAANLPRIAYREARDALRDSGDADLALTLSAYLDAARALEASNAAELAEKAGPLFDARMTVQRVARDLADGVLLEFDWARLVNGYGVGGSYGGTSYWNTASGGSATITLSDSVAAMWPSAGVHALVAHEVGHAILARADCNALFFESEFAAAGEELWATAWAIGLGHTADGSGESIYGRPSDALIALSQQCR